MADLPPILTGQETYLGDGLFVSSDGAGLKYKLRAPREGGDHVVYLDPSMIAELQSFTRRVVTAAHLHQEAKYREHKRKEQGR